MKLIATCSLLVAVVLAAPEDDLITGIRTFAATFYKELIKNKQNQNVIFSPISIQTLMGLLSSASRNEKDKVIVEIRKSLNFPNNIKSTQDAFDVVLENLNKADDDFKAFDATKMYVTNDYKIEDWYQTIARNVYRAGIQAVDFQDAGTSQIINQWVASRTNNKITNFVDQNDIQNTQNLMINTLYLFGKWDKPFLQEENIFKNFHNPNGAKLVTMMTNNMTYDYYEDNDAQYLKLQMLRDGGGAEMVFVLPNQNLVLSELENKMQNVLQNATFTAAKVVVTLPKFSISNDLDLKDHLQNIGVKKLFKGAKLKGFKSPGHPYVIVSDVLQKAFIDVDEWGVTAGVVGKVEIMVDAAPVPTKIFTADRPFLFYITVDEAIVYVGRVMQI